MDMDVNAKQRGSEKLWLDAALDLLATHGIDAVKVMPLAQSLGQSRTSFYWHFKSRTALKKAMIQHWEEQNTGNLIARTEAYAESIAEAMFNLFDCWLDNTLFDARLDLAIRNWARNDPALQVRLDQADTLRSDAITAMFRRFGFSEVQAEVRAKTVMYTQIGYISMRITEDWNDRIARMPDYVQVFTGQAPNASDTQRFMSRHQKDQSC